MCLKLACSTCNKTVSHRNSITCAQFFKPIHLKCNNLNFVDSQLIQNSNSSWFCLHSSNNIFPFTNFTNKKVQSAFSNREYHVDDYIDNLINTWLVLKPQENLTYIFNEFIEDLEYLLKSTSINFDVIAISETRVVKGKTSINCSNLMNYSHEFCPTESSAGGMLLYIRNHLSCKPQNDLCIYKPTELESSFIEISNPKRSNIIIGCIYRHPKMDLYKFNDKYFNTFLDKISKENKSVFLIHDFIIDVLKHDKHAPTNEFLDSLPSNMFLSHIFQPTRISTVSKTLIDNIFSNIYAPSSI